MGLGSGLMAGVKVLVVDDSRFFREMFATELVKYLPPGSEIEKASDAYAHANVCVCVCALREEGQ